MSRIDEMNKNRKAIVEAFRQADWKTKQAFELLVSQGIFTADDWGGLRGKIEIFAAGVDAAEQEFLETHIPVSNEIVIQQTSERNRCADFEKPLNYRGWGWNRKKQQKDGTWLWAMFKAVPKHLREKTGKKQWQFYIGKIDPDGNWKKYADAQIEKIEKS